MTACQRPTLLLLIPHLAGGGSERVIETLARSLDSAKYNVHLALIAPAQSHHQLPSLPATVHQLAATRVRRSIIPLLSLIWKIRPDLILSGIAHLNLLVLALKPFIPRATRIMVRQNGALAETLRSISPLLSRRAYSLAYRHADRVICQSKAMAQEIRSGLHVRMSDLVVLPNPTDVSSIRSMSFSQQKSISAILTLIAIGRLVPQKGFDLLLDALAALPPQLSSTELILVGEGPQQSHLERQALELGIRSRIHFVGHVPDPVVRFPYATAFVLSSRTEGMPNAMLEAAAAGLPIVATPASAGVVDLLKNHDGVWLASCVSSEALRIVLQDALVSLRPGQRYPHMWIEPYELPRALASYESEIDRLLVCRSS
ncbi:glycosyltransferase [Occallatibacter savannae]|uniref:glycosyltransferase n=1 Tax=Occallatibacter savannae TaxID=1002691 RepID=UPI000D69E069|nr:glycosyltransferase [Occallatibacter savannae]